MLTELSICSAYEKTAINTDKKKPDLYFKGTVLSGSLSLGQKLLLGPDESVIKILQLIKV